MQAISSSPIRHCFEQPRHRPAPRRCLIQCNFRPETSTAVAASFVGGIGSNRADWLSCLASKVVTSQQQEEDKEPRKSSSDHLTSINSHPLQQPPPPPQQQEDNEGTGGGSSASVLDLVPVKENARPNALTITDLFQAPMHGSQLPLSELTLTKMGRNVARVAVDDTAGAAEFLAEHNLRDTAAIASSRAAELYGMQVLADGIQDDSSYVTRTDQPFKTSEERLEFSMM